MCRCRVIEVEGLTRRDGGRPAIADLTFSVPEGQVVALLGPAGAGKTTAARMLAGCLEPSSGRASVGGFDLARQPREARRQIGYLPQATAVHRDMRVAGALEMTCRLRGVNPRRRPALVGRALEVCGLGGLRGELIGRLSAGFRRRVGLAQAVVHEPAAVILDEPAAGLDPVQSREVWALLRELGQQGAVVVASRQPAEVLASCQRVLLVREGRIVADATPAGLRRRLEAQGPGAGAGVEPGEPTLHDLFEALAGGESP